MMWMGLFVILCIFGTFAWFLANWTWCSDWRRRYQHQCGYVDNWGHPTICPHCGEEDAHWHHRICRWNFKWRFKEESKN